MSGRKLHIFGREMHFSFIVDLTNSNIYDKLVWESKYSVFTEESLFMYTAFELFINILETFLFIYLIKNKMSVSRLGTKKFFVSCTVFIAAVIELLVNNYGGTLFSVIICMIMHFTITLFLCIDSVAIKCFWTVIFSALGMSAESIIILVSTNIGHIDLNAILEIGGSRFIFTLIYISILSFFIIFLLAFNTKTFYLNRFERFTFISISFLYIIVEQLLFIALVNSNKTKTAIDTAAFFLIMLLFFITIFYVYDLGSERRKNVKLVQENTINKLEAKHYKQVMSSIEEIRSIRHDMRNHFSLISSYIDSGQYQEALDYLFDISKNLEQGTLISSGNLAVDSILSTKISEAQHLNIPLQHTVHLCDHIPLSDVEICSLLGNLIDNAIEGICRFEESNDKCILNICIKPYNNMLSIKVTNSFNGILQKDADNMPISSKQAATNIGDHGIGLKHIQKIVKKYDGSMNLSYSENIFKVSIIIPVLNNR